MVQQVDIPVILFNMLAEGVADISMTTFPVMAYIGVLRKDFHGFLIYGKAHIGLMIDPVLRLKHVMGGMNIKCSVHFRHIHVSCVKWILCIGTINRNMVQFIPIHIILDDPDHLFILKLILIVFTADNISGIFSFKITAKF